VSPIVIRISDESCEKCCEDCCSKLDCYSVLCTDVCSKPLGDCSCECEEVTPSCEEREVEWPEELEEEEWPELEWE